MVTILDHGHLTEPFASSCMTKYDKDAVSLVQYLDFSLYDSQHTITAATLAKQDIILSEISSHFLIPYQKAVPLALLTFLSLTLASGGKYGSCQAEHQVS